jgi:hypothetical protein
VKADSQASVLLGRVSVSLAAMGLGLMVVWQTPYALAVGGALLFVVLWRTAPRMLLVWPAAWVAFGDSTLLGMLGIRELGVLYVGLDVWLLGCLIAALAWFIKTGRVAALLQDPVVMGIAGLWGAHAISVFAGGQPLTSTPTTVGAVRALVAVAWYLPFRQAVEDGGGRAVDAIVLLTSIAVALKGLAFWLMGFGALAAAGGMYRAFGSEEATVGLLLTSWSVAQGGAGNRPGRAVVPILGMGLGILLLCGLRAYWLVAAGVALVVVLVRAVREPGRTARATAIGVLGAGSAIVWLRSVGEDVYQAVVERRLTSLLGGAAAAQNDPSMAYRAIEVTTVNAAVGRNWLFGKGLSGAHRGVQLWLPDDAATRVALETYVHNSFLWSYLKAGVVGVLGTVAFFVGLLRGSIIRYRILPDGAQRQAVLGFMAAAGGLVVLSMFNAHVAFSRYMIVVGAAAAWALADRGPADRSSG